MPLILPPLDFSVVCDGKEMELFNINQENPSSLRAFIASEAGKVNRFYFLKLFK
jgi:hypothetical protein